MVFPSWVSDADYQNFALLFVPVSGNILHRYIFLKCVELVKSPTDQSSASSRNMNLCLHRKMHSSTTLPSICPSDARRTALFWLQPVDSP